MTPPYKPLYESTLSQKRTVYKNGHSRSYCCARSDCQKSLAEFSAQAENKVYIIFDRGVYVGKNTSQAASVEFVRRRRTNYARSRLQKTGGKARRVFSTSETGTADHTAVPGYCLMTTAHFRAVFYGRTRSIFISISAIRRSMLPLVKKHFSTRRSIHSLQR